MDINGNITYLDLEDLIKYGVEIECYVCEYTLDRTLQLNIVKKIEPTKGVLRNIGYSMGATRFFPYGKKGQLLKTGIPYYGKKSGSRLSANVNEEEIYKIWKSLKENALRTLFLYEDRIIKTKKEIENDLKGD